MPGNYFPSSLPYVPLLLLEPHGSKARQDDWPVVGQIVHLVDRVSKISGQTCGKGETTMKAETSGRGCKEFKFRTEMYIVYFFNIKLV